MPWLASFYLLVTLAGIATAGVISVLCVAFLFVRPLRTAAIIALATGFAGAIHGSIVLAVDSWISVGCCPVPWTPRTWSSWAMAASGYASALALSCTGAAAAISGIAARVRAR
jgi:hypothetical protein